MEAENIAWGAVLGRHCPVCDHCCGFREIGPYTRTVIELFPTYRRGRVLIARFLCRSGSGTFSLLPHQLVPYRQYTAESMAWAVWFVSEFSQDGHHSPWHRALDVLPCDTDATPWLLRCWLYLLQRGFRSWHSTLRIWFNLNEVRTGAQVSDHLREVHTYLGALGIRAQPPADQLTPILARFGQRERRFLLGVPSQERRRLSPVGPSRRLQ